MKGSVLIISGEAWGTNYVSKHLYAIELAKRYKVYFLNPVRASKLSLKKDPALNKMAVGNNLEVISYTNYVPKLDKLPRPLQLNYYRKLSSKIQSFLKVENFEIVWSFDPHRFYDQSVWNCKHTIFQCMDFHNQKADLKRCASSSDLSIEVSKGMLEGIKALAIGHAISLDQNQIDCTDRFPKNGRLNAMYLGNISGLLDIKRLAKLAEAHTNVNFILIGPTNPSNLSGNESDFDLSALEKENIFLLGEIPAQHIQSYFEHSDINLLMLKDRPNIPNTNSHKLMYYFNSGKVTLSDWMSDYTADDTDLIQMSKTKEEFESKFKMIIESPKEHNTISLQKKRREFARSNTYADKVELILSKLM